MFRTTGILDKEFYDSIKSYLLPQRSAVLMKCCIAVLILCYLAAFLLQDLSLAFICVFGISLYFFSSIFIIRKIVKINLNRMDETFHTDSIEYSSEFSEEAIISSVNVRKEDTYIYYKDVSRIILTSKCYLIFTKAEQLIFVFPEQLKERERWECLGTLKEKVPKIKVNKESPKKKYLFGALLIIFYLSFAVFLYNYFTKPEEAGSEKCKAHTEMADDDASVNTTENRISDEDIETRQLPVTEINLQIKNPLWEYYCKEEFIEAETPSMSLELVSEKENDIIDLEVWLEENNLSAPELPYSDEKYFYDYTGVFYETTNLVISETTDMKYIYQIDLTDFSMLPGKTIDPDQTFTDDRGYVNYAKIEDNLLYVSTGHRGYTENNPSTGYITAIDLESGEVIWKTAPQISNARNFEIVGDVIVCGYGFTDESDYLYVLNKSNGQVMEQIPLKTQAEYIVAKDSTLYVRTYNRNYEFAICGLANSASVDFE